MASVGVLCLARSFSALNIHASSRNICLRGISRKVLFEKLQLPEKPKKPLAPFVAFYKNSKAFIEKECAGMSVSEKSKKIGKLWQELSASEKLKYREQYQREYEIYKENLKAFQESLTEEQMNEINQAITEVTETKERALLRKMKHDKIREFNKPKAPPNAFIKFMQSRDHGNQTGPVFWKKMSSEWKQLSDKEKEVYINEYNEEKAKYLSNLEKWEHEMIEKGYFDIVRTETIKKKFKNFKD